MGFPVTNALEPTAHIWLFKSKSTKSSNNNEIGKKIKNELTQQTAAIHILFYSPKISSKLNVV